MTPFIEAQIITITVLCHVNRHWRDHDDHTNH